MADYISNYTGSEIDTGVNVALSLSPLVSEIEAGKVLSSNNYTTEEKEKLNSLRNFKSNLLDNSNFANPVNQRQATTYNSFGYSLDRWKIENIDGGALSIQDGYITITAGNAQLWFSQYFEKQIPIGTQVTFAVKETSGTITVLNMTIVEGGSAGNIPGRGDVWFASEKVSFVPQPSNTWNIEWMVLYKGTYTADTLPEYQPKGYAAELAECQRYYQVIPFRSNYNMPVAAGTRFSATAARIPLIFPQDFRISPTMTIDDTIELNVVNGGTAKSVETSGISISTSVKNKVVINVTSSDLVSGYPVVLYGGGTQGAGIQCIRFSADL